MEGLKKNQEEIFDCKINKIQIHRKSLVHFNHRIKIPASVHSAYFWFSTGLYLYPQMMKPDNRVQ